MGSYAKSFEDLDVYKMAFDLQQAIFEITKTFPSEEKYSLIDQIRRSSRSVGANIAEAWNKRRYQAHFISKLTDADAELAETRHWITTAYSASYISEQKKKDLISESLSIGRHIGSMINNASKWCKPLN